MEQYLTFKGLSTRSEYWAVSILSFIAFIIVVSIGSIVVASGSGFGFTVGILLILAAIVLYIWLFLAVAVKRCRDGGINPWWTAACFIPYIGWIVWIVIGCIPSTQLK